VELCDQTEQKAFLSKESLFFDKPLNLSSNVFKKLQDFRGKGKRVAGGMPPVHTLILRNCDLDADTALWLLNCFRLLAAKKQDVLAMQKIFQKEIEKMYPEMELKLTEEAGKLLTESSKDNKVKGFDRLIFLGNKQDDLPRFKDFFLACFPLSRNHDLKYQMKVMVCLYKLLTECQDISCDEILQQVCTVRSRFLSHQFVSLDLRHNPKIGKSDVHDFKALIDWFGGQPIEKLVLGNCGLTDEHAKELSEVCGVEVLDLRGNKSFSWWGLYWFLKSVGKKEKVTLKNLYIEWSMVIKKEGGKMCSEISNALIALYRSGYKLTIWAKKPKSGGMLKIWCAGNPEGSVRIMCQRIKSHARARPKP